MACLTQQVSFTVKAPWLDVPVQLAPVDEVEGRYFFKIAKTCNKTTRLLTGRSIGKTRALTHTKVIEHLQKLRNDKCQELITEAEKKQSGEADDDLGLDVPDPKRMKKLTCTLPAIVDIELPTYNNISGISMSLMAASGNAAVAVELTDSNINYLHDIVKNQLADHPAADEDEDEEDTVPHRPRGVQWCEAKSAYRVKYADGDKKREKYFRPKSMNEADKVAAVEEARDFLANRSSAS